jgi:hypothetical protein
VDELIGLPGHSRVCEQTAESRWTTPKKAPPSGFSLSPHLDARRQSLTKEERQLGSNAQLFFLLIFHCPHCWGGGRVGMSKVRFRFEGYWDWVGAREWQGARVGVQSSSHSYSLLCRPPGPEQSDHEECSVWTVQLTGQKTVNGKW